MDFPVDSLNLYFATLAAVGARNGELSSPPWSSALDELRMAATNLPINPTRVAMAEETVKALLAAAPEIAAVVQKQMTAVTAAGKDASTDGRPSYQQKACYVQTMMHVVAPGLFVGSYHPASDKLLLQKSGITHICCCIGVSPRFPDTFHYHVIPAEDAPSYDMSQHFDAAVTFIDTALRGGGNVLVHCGAGISRAPTITAAYLINITGLSANAAVQLLRQRRPCASPNMGFLTQLRDYSRKTDRADGGK